jgi:predicted ester cyclase
MGGNADRQAHPDRAFEPGVIVLDCCDAQITGLGSINMEADDMREVSGVPPSGKDLRISPTMLLSFRNGKIVE